MRHESSGATFGVAGVDRQVIVRTIGAARPAVLRMFAGVLEAPRVDAVARLTLCGGPDGYIVGGARVSEPPDGSLEDAVRLLRQEVTRHLMSARADLAWIHAAAAARSDSAVLLAGPSGCGKSTLVTHLLRRGYRYLGDDVIPLEPETGRLKPLPLSPRVRQPVSEFLCHESARQLTRSIIAVGDDHVCRRDVRPSLVVFPEFSDGSTRARVCSASETAVLLLQHLVGSEPPLEGTVRAVCRLAAAVSGLVVTYRDPDAVAAFVARTHADLRESS